MMLGTTGVIPTADYKEAPTGCWGFFLCAAFRGFGFIAVQIYDRPQMRPSRSAFLSQKTNEI